MCGVCGELRFDGVRASKQTVQQMLVPLQNRGPDNEGIHMSGAVGFGHRRLSIIDLSAQANQPMQDKHKNLSIVFNGTIYNYPQLREQLINKGHSFVSSGDTEVILKAFAEWGKECVAKLVGMFAFAIWNESKQELFLARDRLGIKPLYYSKTDNYFRFASNTQALLAAGDVNTAFDAIGLHHHLSLHAVVPAPTTILKGLRKVPPAHYMIISKQGKVITERYWKLRADHVDTQRDEQEWLHDIHATLSLAVERRLNIADVPVGVLLSGGLDSSLLVGLLAESGVADIQTYSVGFEDQPEEQGNEFEYSDAVVEKFSTQHNKFYIQNDEVLKRLPHAIDHMAEPMVGQDAVAFYLLAEQVSQHITVVQSGQGADEVFGGYFWYPLMQAENNFSVESFAKHYVDRSHAEISEALHADYVAEDFTATKVSQLLEDANTKNFLDAVLHMDVTTLIVDDPVKRVDNMTMAYGLEARVPFLDHELVELAMRAPTKYKTKDGGKFLLKKIARGLLPNKVIDRKKGYFPVPALKYVRGEFLGFMQDILNSQACRQRGLFQPSYIDKLLNKPEAYMTPLRGSKLWHLALLELWLQRNVDTAIAT
ncbi:MAG: N-acetylglutaminylglutamine amidotransferase [Gammaproteobacteria bacterium]